MVVQNLLIIFDNLTSVFTPDQTITERVLIAVGDSVKIRSMGIYINYMCMWFIIISNFTICYKLKFKGDARVSWTEKESRKNKNEESEKCHVKYHIDKTYFYYNSILVNSGVKWTMIFILNIMFIYYF